MPLIIGFSLTFYYLCKNLRVEPALDVKGAESSFILSAGRFLGLCRKLNRAHSL